MADDFTKAARAAKQEAWQDGYNHAKRHILPNFATTEEMEGRDRYLDYLFFLGIAQAIANHGRTIAGLDAGKSRYEPEARKNAAGTR